MPLAAALELVKNLIDNLQMPQGMNVPCLQAWIVAPDPDDDAPERPEAYVWPMPGSEKRLTVPRNTGPGTPAGWKTICHEIGIWLVWEQSEDEQDADTLFTGYMDALMDALRTAYPMPAILTDPWTGEQTGALNAGENMSYETPPPRTLNDERFLRFDALIRVPVIEQIQR